MKHLIAILVFFGILGSYIQLASAQQRPNAVVILDASRSMWGQISGSTKILIARNALTDSFLKYNGRLNLGVIAYGHQHASACNDIQKLQSVKRLDAPTASLAIAQVRPKGSTPIASSLKTAADMLNGKGPSKNIILISDGLDNCKADPCATAGALKSADKSLNIHVIAFDKKSKQKGLRGLQCISRNGGGQFYAASSEEGLRVALARTLNTTLVSSPTITSSTDKKKNVINLNGWKKVTTGAARGQRKRDRIEFDLRGGKPQKENYQPSASQRFNAAGQQGVAAGLTPISLTALLNDGGLPIQNNLVWRIFSAKPDKAGKYKLLSTHREANPTAALAPGEYLVNSSYGRAYLTKKMTVKIGQPINEIFVMNAGGVRLGSVLANGSPVPNHTVAYTIYSDERDQFGTRQKVISDAKPGLIIRLNAGIYHIVSRYGDANAIVSADVTIEAGKLTEATINHTAAKVTFKLVFERGGEALADTKWSIMTPQGDPVKDSIGALPTHILAAGNYVVMARRSGQIFKQPFQVKPGETKQIEVVVR